MNLADCYRLLGLSDGASQSEIKASYRRLARQCHPDVNVGDGLAQTKFIELTEAYKLLLNVVKASGTTESVQNSQTVRGTKQPPTQPPSIPPLSEIEYQLKWTFYERLQELLKEQRFARAIALVEGLAQRIPHDPEVRQWQAITYQCWGRYLVKDGQLDKARIYLKKALKTDPHNRSLWAEVELDFRRMEQRV